MTSPRQGVAGRQLRWHSASSAGELRRSGSSVDTQKGGSKPMKPRWFLLPALGATFVLVAVAGAANGHANFRAVCPGAPVGAAHCHALVVTDANGNPTASSTPPAGSYGPAQFHTGYGLPTTASSAQTIGIVDAYNDPNIENDLAVYDFQYGLPSCTTPNGCFEKFDHNGRHNDPP